MAKKYDEPRLAFLRTGYPLMTLPELTASFNRYFGEQVTETAIKAALCNHGIRAGSRRGRRRKIRDRDYSIEVLEFIRLRYRDVTGRELVAELREFYGIRTTVRRLAQTCKNHGFRSGRTGYFPKGHIPWTKGTKGMVKPNSGQFKKGDRPEQTKPLGHERVCSKDGYLLVKVDEMNPYTGKRGFYRKKHVLLWEEYHGKVQPGHIVVFKDGDRLNITIENLEAIPRALNVRLNKFRYRKQPPQLKPTIRALAELQAKAGELKQKSGEA